MAALESAIAVFVFSLVRITHCLLCRAQLGSNSSRLSTIRRLVPGAVSLPFSIDLPWRTRNTCAQLRTVDSLSLLALISDHTGNSLCRLGFIVVSRCTKALVLAMIDLFDISCMRSPEFRTTLVLYMRLYWLIVPFCNFRVALTGDRFAQRTSIFWTRSHNISGPRTGRDRRSFLHPKLGHS